MGHGPLFKRQVLRSPALTSRAEAPVVSFGISPGFPGLSPTRRQVTHALLTRLPLYWGIAPFLARLACVRHAASVRSEPGSNSPIESLNLHPCGRSSLSDSSFLVLSVMESQGVHIISGSLCLVFKEQSPPGSTRHRSRTSVGPGGPSEREPLQRGRL